MIPTLFTINALATEFGLDRRTVANRLKNIPHARTEGGSKLWYLTDVVSALSPNQSHLQHESPLLADFRDRLDHFEEIHCRPQIEMTLDEFAEVIGKEPETVLQQLRAGMPFRTEGDWHTGEGFTVTPAHSHDWLVFMAVLTRISGSVEFASELGL
jgi:hypothetical protein